MTKRLWAELRRQWIGASLGLLALFVALGGTLVFAHGGDTTQVHACVEVGQTARPNTIIVGADAGCPDGYTATHWSVQGPAGPAGPPGPAGPQGEAGPAGQPPLAAAPDPPTINEVVAFGKNAQLGGWFKNTKIRKGPWVAHGAPRTAFSLTCPASYPKLAGGNYETDDLEVADIDAPVPVPGWILWYNGEVEGPRWKTTAVAADSAWKLRAYAICKK